ncbi:MAG: T9SS type A sorting domain-containing protein [Bacteroidetes bacterium]|nr:T9SS type A sorting domain-containing protein [Bacteroidota bacterium]
MNAISTVIVRCGLLIAAYFLAAVPATSNPVTFTGTIKLPCNCSPQRTATYVFTAVKTPGLSTEGHCWCDVTYDNPPQPGDPDYGQSCKFIVCATIALSNQQPANLMVYSFQPNVPAGTWECIPNGSTTGDPNYLIGCRQVELSAGQTMVHIIDDILTFSTPFAEPDLAGVNMDVYADCPNGVDPNCSAIFTGNGPGGGGHADVSIVAGSGVTPSPGCGGTGSVDVKITGVDDDGSGNQTGTAVIPLGNMMTNGHKDKSFDVKLIGDVSGGGAGTVEISSPAAGLGIETFAIGSHVETSTFTITQDVASNPDANIYITVKYANGSAPDGNVVHLTGALVAQNNTTFAVTGDDPIYSIGDHISEVDAQFVQDQNTPTIVSQQMEQQADGTIDLTIVASDDYTMAAACSFEFDLNGQQHIIVPVNFDPDAPMMDNTQFKAVLGPYEPGSTITNCHTHVADEAGNVRDAEDPGEIVVLGVTEGSGGTGYRLEQNVPNPFDAKTTIDFSLPRREHVTLTVFDAAGHAISTLVDGIRDPGSQHIELDAAAMRLSSGTYYYRLQTPQFTATRRLVLLRGGR